MRWGTPNPQELEYRHVERFALLPTRLSNGTWVWLEPFIDFETAREGRWHRKTRRLP